MPSPDQPILDYIADHPGAGRAAIRRAVAPEDDPSTVWRTLRRLVDEGRLEVSGKGRATGYTIAGSAVVRAHLNTPYNRRPPVTYRKDFLDAYVPGKTYYLPGADRERLLQAGRPVGGPIAAGTYARRILEQLLVDLSWASSRMEGNTYDILQTERLIRFGEEAAGKDRKEALMILNHKEAIQYVVDNLDDITLRRADLFAIHALLSDGLLGDPGMAGCLRAGAVGISHSSYKPLDDAVTIAEEFDILIAKAAEITDPFEQSFFLLVHIPYLQAFIDINKRTSRVASNVPLRADRYLRAEQCRATARSLYRKLSRVGDKIPRAARRSRNTGKGSACLPRVCARGRQALRAGVQGIPEGPSSGHGNRSRYSRERPGRRGRLRWPASARSP